MSFLQEEDETDCSNVHFMASGDREEGVSDDYGLRFASVCISQSRLFITDDKSWVYGYNPETQAKSLMGKSPL